MQNKVRIIAGRWRGRKISFLTQQGLRPTPNRTRETLFNWLTPKIVNSTCLDLFAGSGALGIEALSRGAESVDFIEADKSICACLQENLIKLNANNGKVIQSNAIAWLQRNARQNYDIIFIDPPFGQGLVAQVIMAIAQYNLIHANSVLYIEHEKALQLDFELNIIRSGKTSQTIFKLVTCESLIVT